MTDLIARLEAAEGPDRELDAEIENLLAGGSDRDLEYIVSNGVEDTTAPPRYTASIDAALTLVPEGWTWGIMHCAGAPPEVCFYRAVCGVYSSIVAVAATPALALCIAALKARNHDR